MSPTTVAAIKPTASAETTNDETKGMETAWKIAEVRLNMAQRVVLKEQTNEPCTQMNRERGRLGARSDAHRGPVSCASRK